MAVITSPCFGKFRGWPHTGDMKKTIQFGLFVRKKMLDFKFSDISPAVFKADFIGH
jgi:hypothetical protein